jgi:hypothetical protein
MTKTKPRTKRSKVQGKASKQKPVSGAKSPRLLTALECAKVGMREAPMHGTKKGRCTCLDPKCKRPGRHLRTPNGIADATSNPEEIEKFLTTFPKARIAVATGVAGMIALKVTGEAAKTSLKELLSSAHTVEIEDGKSRIFLWKVETDAIPEGRVCLSTGVTVLGRDRYFIAPDDLDAPKGKRRFVSRGLLGDMDIAPAPDWLLARLRPRLLGINAMPLSTGSERVRFKTATIDVKSIYDGGDPSDPEEVKLRARSLSETGPRMPPAVRLIEDESGRPDVQLYEVLTDRCQVEALKSLGATAIRCVVVDADEDGARVWQLAELFNQRHTTVLRRAELGMKCVEIIRRKGGQRAQGGQQPNDKGMSSAERILGVSRRDLGRFEKIDGISAEAKKEAQCAELDDNQNALLAIAKVSAEKQVEKVRELGNQSSGRRRERAAVAKTGNPSSVSSDDVEDDADEPEPGTDSDRPGPTDKGTKEDSSRGKRGASDSEAAAESPPTVPDDEEPEISPALARRRDEDKLTTLKSIYAKHLAPEWKDTSPKIGLQFVTEVLRVSTIVIAHEDAVDFVRKLIDGRPWIHAREVYANTDEHGFKRKHIRGALVHLGYRLKKKGRENRESWIYKITDPNFKDRLHMSEREVDETDDDYYGF